MEFDEANKVFTAFIKKKLKAEGDIRPVEHKQPLTEEDSAKLNVFFKNCTSDPIKLWKFVWFIVTEHFCFERERDASKPVCGGFSNSAFSH